MQAGKPLMNGLAKEAVARLERSLRDRRAELARMVAGETSELNDPLSTEVPAPEGLGDREAGSAALRDVAASLSQAHRIELESIEAALSRISAGEYGTCVACGESIGAERLVAQPTATRCTACQSASERGRPHASL